MSAKPYSDEEISAARSHLARLSNADKRNGDIIAVARDVERRWLATVDALQSRLAAAEAAANTAKVAADLFRERAEKAEARAERAVGLLVKARLYVRGASYVSASGDIVQPDEIRASIDALLKEVSGG